MASKRICLAPRFLRPQHQTTIRPLSTARPFPLPVPAHLSKRPADLHSQRAPSVQHQHSKRWHSTPPSKTKVYDFDAMKSFTASPSDERILIDVREPSEYSAGYIPGSINLPIKSAPEALLLPADEFEDRFGFAKPSAQHEVVFYCKSGVRSSAAAKLAEQAGYQRVGEYRGSWLDWSGRGGEVAQ